MYYFAEQFNNPSFTFLGLTDCLLESKLTMFVLFFISLENIVFHKSFVQWLLYINLITYHPYFYHYTSFSDGATFHIKPWCNQTTSFRHPDSISSPPIPSIYNFLGIHCYIIPSQHFCFFIGQFHPGWPQYTVF